MRDNMKINDSNEKTFMNDQLLYFTNGDLSVFILIPLSNMLDNGISIYTERSPLQNKEADHP